MPVLTRSKSQILTVGEEAGWGSALAESIDETVHRLGADRDVINVATTPLAAGQGPGYTPTVAVVVTVVWREPRAGG
jgi:hypothetical protein